MLVLYDLTLMTVCLGVLHCCRPHLLHKDQIKDFHHQTGLVELTELNHLFVHCVQCGTAATEQVPVEHRLSCCLDVTSNGLVPTASKPSLPSPLGSVAPRLKENCLRRPPHSAQERQASRNPAMHMSRGMITVG